MLLQTSSFSVQLSDTRVLDSIQLELGSSCFMAILGGNGQGKSTLLHALSGGMAAVAAQIFIQQKALSQWTPLALARQRAMLTQNIAFGANMTGQDAVLLGRYPFYAAYGSPRLEDYEVVEAVLKTLQLGSLAHQSLHTCSGGQQQLLQVARVLAQVWDSTPEQPKLLFLDEPTSNLDIRYQHLLLGQLREWLPHKGWGIVAVLHDLNLAAQYADQLLLLRAGRIHTQGRPHQVLTPAHIQAVFGVPAHCYQLPETQQIHCLIHPSFTFDNQPT